MQQRETGLHRRGSMRKSVNFFLDIPFRGGRNDYFQSWAAIYLKPLVSALLDVKHRASPNDCLPPWVERRGRKNAPPPQGRAPRIHRRGKFGSSAHRRPLAALLLHWVEGIAMAITLMAVLPEGRKTIVTKYTQYGLQRTSWLGLSSPLPLKGDDRWWGWVVPQS